jgi:hypothetical protein
MNDADWAIVREFNQIRPSELVEMIERFPAIKISWESFLINYKLCQQEIEIG